MAGLQAGLEQLVDAYASAHGVSMQLALITPTRQHTAASGATSSDRFLFGSGTKPYTATQLLQAVDAEALTLEEPAARLIDAGIQSAASPHAAARFVDLFGPRAARVTVGHLIRMQSGIADFDVPKFDDPLLRNASAIHTPLEFIKVAAALPSPFVCDPGSCTSYSSTNYILLGFILLAVENGRVGAASSAVRISGGAGRSGGTPWSRLAQRAVFRGDGRFGNCTFIDSGGINRGATVAGSSSSFSSIFSRSPVRIWAQDASILGWTCGNLAAPALEVARFYEALLLRRDLISASSLDSMLECAPIDNGWARGVITYCGGLMLVEAARRGPYPPKLGDWGTYLGHGGDTYGFLSEQGVLPRLNASFSVVVSSDSPRISLTFQVVCPLIEMAAWHLQKIKLSLGCPRRDSMTHAAAPALY